MGVAEVGFILSGLGTISNLVSQSDVRENQKKTQKEQAASQAEKAASERRQQIREERIRRAQLIQSSENTGTTGSSGLLGGLSNLSTQLGSNIGYAAAQTEHSNVISNAMQEAADSQGMAGLSNNVSGLGLSLFQAGGGFNSITLPEEWRAAGTSNVGPTRGFIK